jgi:tetratricopeptide (TPR) repeat protein
MQGRIASIVVALTVLALAPLVGTSAARAQSSAPAGYHEHVRTAMSSFVVGDHASAARHFREALALAPSQPDALCYMAEMNRAMGDLNGALDGFQDCLRFAREGNERRFVARALHGIASTLERMPERTQDARNAWQEYIRFADTSAGLADGRIGRTRTEVIDAWVALEQRMVEVRARIAERERAAH